MPAINGSPYCHTYWKRIPVFSGVNEQRKTWGSSEAVARRCSMKKVFHMGVLRNFEKFTGKHVCQDLFFNKAASLCPTTLLKNILWHRCFPLNFAKFLRTLFLQNTSSGCFWYVFIFYQKNLMSYLLSVITVSPNYYNWREILNPLLHTVCFNAQTILSIKFIWFLVLSGYDFQQHFLNVWTRF